jgi:hypothetical protein
MCLWQRVRVNLKSRPPTKEREMSDLASAAAAVAAGYIKTQTDRGAGAGSPRYITTFDKLVIGGGDEAHANTRAVGTSDASAAAADTQALAALNGQRNIRYGTGTTAGNDSRGKQHTFDVS